ncbi:uncharacterized protein V1518DRAFT_415349 [Limtongia smithiae]|uniref:uncharacterized protein n=1 Tax=Limtongia smithiae TaxID=1125753 RepID=UPI0034CEDEB2
MAPFMRGHTRNSSQTSAHSASAALLPSAADAPAAAPSAGPSHASSFSISTSFSSLSSSSAGPKRKAQLQRAATMPAAAAAALGVHHHHAAPGLSKSASVTSSSSFYAQPSTVVHAGDVVASVGLLRGKKKDFIVLTRNELLRFKSRAKAADMFPSVAIGSAVPASSAASISDTASLHSLDHSICSLDRVIAVFEIGPTHLQISYIDDSACPHSTILQFSTRPEAEVWILKFRSTVPKQTIAHAVSPSICDSLRNYLSIRGDFNPACFGAYHVVLQNQAKLHNLKQANPTSSDDLVKLANASIHAVLVVGNYAVHLIAMDSKSTSMIMPTNGLPPQYSPLSSHGIISLVHLAMSPRDSTLYLSFRPPLGPVKSIELASWAAKDIIQRLRSCLEFLRPCWVEYPLALDVPEHVLDEPLAHIPSTSLQTDAQAKSRSISARGGNLNGFHTTLQSYCVAYGISNAITKINYTVEWTEDNGLVFKLLPLKSSSASPNSVAKYSTFELLAVLRALRWNEAFGGISFAGVSLSNLVDIADHYAAIELDQTRTQTGRRISKYMKQLPLLVLELQLLMLCSTALRMLDISGCLCGSPSSGGEVDQGCGAIDGIMQVAKRGSSNVDSFVFSNIQIGPYDFDYLVDVASTRAAHLRNLEIARCGLHERELTLLIQALEIHENTLEGLDISENPGRISAFTLNESLYRFQYMRYLSMRSLPLSSDEFPLLSTETLLNMQLKTLILDSTRLRPMSVNHLCGYLENAKSSSLVNLSLQSCGLTGAALGDIFSAIGGRRSPPHAGMTIYIGDNPICLAGFDRFLHSLLTLGKKVRRISMPRLEFSKEKYLCALFKVLADPRCQITHLDISMLLIPDADASPETCDLLGEVFAHNTTLRSLNLTGETSKLQVARIGHGLGRALTRLAANSTLRDLYISGNELSVDGAMSLAQALTVNRSLRRLYIDDNDINLQGFTAVVNSIVDSRNRSIRYVSRPDRDQDKSLLFFRDLCKNLDMEIAGLKQQKRGSNSDKDSSHFMNGSGKHNSELHMKIEARRDASDNLKIVEEEWKRIYTKLDQWVKQSKRESTCTDDNDDDDVENVEDAEKLKKVWEKLRIAGAAGKKISAGGRVVN